MSVFATVEADAKKVLSVMETIGKEAEKCLADIQPYLPEAAALAAIFFPSAAAPAAAVVSAVDLIQNTVVTVEQKYAAAGISAETGTQKAADTIALVGPAVTALLASEKIPVNTALIQQVVNGTVAILNVRTVAAAPVATAPAVEPAAALGASA
jgi:phage tail protein X